MDPELNPKKPSSSKHSKIIKKSKSDFINGLKIIVKVSKVFSGDTIKIQFVTPRIYDNENSGKFFKTGRKILKKIKSKKYDSYMVKCNIYGIVAAPIETLEGLVMKHLLEYMIFERDMQNGILYGILKTTTSHRGPYIELYCDKDFRRTLYPTIDGEYQYWKAKNLNFLIKKLKKLGYRDDVIKYIESYSASKESFLLVAPYGKKHELNNIKIIPGNISLLLPKLFDS